MNMHYSRLSDEETRKKVFNAFNNLYKVREGFTLIDYEIITKNGKKIFVESSVYLIYDSEGEIIGFKGFVRDITERKKTEQKLKDSEKKYRNLIETSSMGLLEIDFMKKGAVYINPKLLNIIGYSKEELNDENIFYKVIYPKNIKKVRKTNEDQTIEFKILNKEGKTVWLSGTLRNQIDDQGNLLKARLWVQDITEKKEMAEIKSNLLTRFSHEFKTPLISIKGFTDLLLTDYKESFNDKTRSFLKKIKEGANKLKLLIDHFIESTMLDRHVVDLNLNQENLSTIIKDGIAEMEGLVRLRNHSINLEINDKLIIDCDKDKIHDVFINLLENAIKFTPKGGNITIQSHINNKSIIISIKDNGIGIKKEEIKQLFQPFGKTEKYGKGWDIISDGIGLGLYFSKEIIDLHKGRIWAKSKGENKGSVFYFSLPIIKK